MAPSVNWNQGNKDDGDARKHRGHPGDGQQQTPDTVFCVGGGGRVKAIPACNTQPRRRRDS